MQVKNVLIITDLFPPSFAPRMGYLSKYLGDHSWKGTAIAPLYESEQKVFGFLSGYINTKRIVISKKDEQKKYKRNIIQKALSLFFPDLESTWRLNREMMQQCKELIRKEQVDLILCSTYRLFPLNIACKIAKLYDLPWIADLRDIYEQYPVKWSFLMELYKKSGIRRRNNLLRKTNAITVVSKRHSELLSRYKLQAQVIYNGFDSDLFQPSTFHQLEKFKIVYTGMIFSKSGVGRDPSPFFSAIQNLHENGKISPQNCRIQFYTNSKSQEIVNHSAKKHGVLDFIDCFEYVSSVDVPKILDDASILLLLLQGRNTGIMTTKFFEYLGVGRPVLCVWTDDGEIMEIMNHSNAGLAAKTEEEIEQFVIMKYDEWMDTGYTNLSIEWDFIKQFSRKVQAKQFVDLFDSVLRQYNKKT